MRAVCILRQKSSTVNIRAVADGENQHQQNRVVNFIDDAIITNAEAVAIVHAGHFFCAGTTRVFGKLLKGDIKALLKLGVADFPQGFLDRGTDFDTVTAHAQPSFLRAALQAMFAPGSASARSTAALSARSSACRNFWFTN